MILAVLLASVFAAAAPGDVAILPFDAVPGVASRDLDVLERGLAIALRRRTSRPAVRGDALEERLAVGKRERLKEARAALEEGYTMLAEGDPDIGLVFFEEAIAAHEDVTSMIARRNELADAHYALAKSLTAMGRITDAQPHLESALRMVPDYLEARGEVPTEVMLAAVRSVERELAQKRPRRLSYAGALSLRSELSVDHIIHGVIGRSDTFVLHVYPRRGDLVSIPHQLPAKVPPLGDTWYDDVAKDVWTILESKTIP